VKPTKRDQQAAVRPSWLVTAPLVLAFLASIIWGLVSVVALVPALIMAFEIDNYRPARFVVEEVVYRAARGNDRYYAKGRIDGASEVFELSDVAPILETREALEKHLGQQPVIFSVMYNPTRMRAKRNDGSTRVLPAEDGFAKRYRDAAWRAALSTSGSVVLAVLALITLVSVNKRRTKR
jgi:hypothetical protein